jgi:heptosyltransferase-1
MNKILIIKPSSLGDIIQAMPVAVALKKQYPSCAIHWFAFYPYRELFREHQAIDQLWTPPPRGWWTPSRWPHAFTFFKKLQSERFDCALDLQGLFRSGFFMALSGARRRVGLHPSREGARLFYQAVHHTHSCAAAARYLEAAAYLGAKAVDPCDFGLGAAPIPPPLDLKPQSYIVIHPFARWKTKLWPWEHYLQILCGFPDDRFVVVGEGAIRVPLPSNALDLRGKSTLWELMGILRHARVVISSDSGPAHIAAAYGVPTLVLFGATDPARTAPQGKRVKILRAPNIACSPCLKRVCHNPETMACMNRLNAEQVIEALRTI